MRQSGAGVYPMTRSESTRRYQNLITYRIRPMLGDRTMDDEKKTAVLKRLVRECHNIRYESGAVAGAGTREEIVDLLAPIIKPGSGYSEELVDWVKRVIRAFGATTESED